MPVTSGEIMWANLLIFIFCASENLQYFKLTCSKDDFEMNSKTLESALSCAALHLLLSCCDVDDVQIIYFVFNQNKIKAEIKLS